MNNQYKSLQQKSSRRHVTGTLLRAHALLYCVTGPQRQSVLLLVQLQRCSSHALINVLGSKTEWHLENVAFNNTLQF